MKVGKVVIAGAAVTIVNAVIGMVTCGGVFNWVYKLEPANVWRPMSGGPGAMFMLASFVVSTILALVYALINKGIPGRTTWKKGIVFGLCVWAVGMLPGMLATYAFMTVATPVVIYWTMLGLLKSPLEGMVIAAIYGE